MYGTLHMIHLSYLNGAVFLKGSGSRLDPDSVLCQLEIRIQAY